MEDDDDEPRLLATQHAISLKFLPTPYQAEDGNRMTLAYFGLSAMSLIPLSAIKQSHETTDEQSAIDALLKPQQITGYIDWVYEQQVKLTGGFRGSDSLDTTPSSATTKQSSQSSPLTRRLFVPANLIQTYAALLILAILDDDFKRLDRKRLLEFVGSCQARNGSFKQYPDCVEPGDPRSTYSAFAIASMLNDWSTVNVERAIKFLSSCERPEGGFAMTPFTEPQGGFTYCTIASFFLAGRLKQLPNRDKHLKWLIERQVEPPTSDTSDADSSDDESDSVNGLEESETTRNYKNAKAAVEKQTKAGFQGRAGKTTDACYSFWCVAPIKLLTGSLELVDVRADRLWLLSCQHASYGGIAREAGATPDIYHTYLALAALSIEFNNDDHESKSKRLLELDPAWNVSKAVATRIKQRLHRH
ncbi:geranylgeranyl transferase type-1 subunit beta [Microbotryomycetes sp. JL221]|nr:geranylgeranyl transferase type-1 subunit beta [Microbotryomycetes sp. JL221]